MATLTVRGLDEQLKTQLRIRAAHHGRSMEAEARAILYAALSSDIMEGGFGTAVHTLFADLDGMELELPSRASFPRAAVFDDDHS